MEQVLMMPPRGRIPSMLASLASKVKHDKLFDTAGFDRVVGAVDMQGDLARIYVPIQMAVQYLQVQLALVKSLRRGRFAIR